MKTSIIIPYIRPSRIPSLVATIQEEPEFHAGDVEVLAEAEEDGSRVGVTRMVKRLTSKARHDLVTFLGDDTLPQPGFIGAAFRAMRSFPDEWGMVALNDTIHGDGGVPAHWMASKRLLPHLGGEFFHTGYIHCFCDMELMERCQAIGRYIWAEDAVVLHDHPVVRGELPDLNEYIGYQERNYMHDRILFAKRRRHGWP